MKQRIKVVCFFYNEAALLPFFLSHYRFADTIHAIVSASTDGTGELLAKEAGRSEEAGRKLIIEPWEMPGGMNDFLKRDKVNEVITRPDGYHDWYLVVDADELIWPEGQMGSGFLGRGSEVGDYLAKIPPNCNCLTAKMWNVYRHHTEADLDITQEPVARQRRHGVADRSGGENALYQKPIVIRANRGMQLEIGNHSLRAGCWTAPWGSNHNFYFDGAHWANADPSFAVTRRCRDRRDRLSDTNRKFGLGTQHFHVTEEAVREQCRAHLEDPQVF